MDLNRGTQPQPVSPGGRPASTTPSGFKKGKSMGNWTNGIVVALVAAVVILLIGAICVVSFGSPPNESKYVDNAKLQAVFLNTGQVYFGHIKTLNSRYFVLSNIYYLQTSNASGSSSSSSTANSNVTLVKLGCELHEPFDQMVINRDQVTFWENLQSGGQVAKAVSTFQKDNPNGQKCSDQSSSSSSTTNAVQSAGNSNSAGSSSTTTPAATKP